MAFPRNVPLPLVFLNLPVPPIAFQVPSHVVSNQEPSSLNDVLCVFSNVP